MVEFAWKHTGYVTNTFTQMLWAYFIDYICVDRVERTFELSSKLNKTTMLFYRGDTFLVEDNAVFIVRPNGVRERFSAERVDAA